MPARSPSQLAALIVSLVCTVTATVVGQDREPKRSLGGHNFVPIDILGDPFVGTYVRSSTGGGTASGLTLVVPDLEGGDLGTFEASIGFLSLAIEYQQNITNWLALRIGGVGGARLGTSVEALLAEGATALFGYNVGLSAQVVRSHRFVLSASLDASPNKAYGISPLDFARSVIDNGLDSASSLLRKADGRRLYVGARSAFVVADWLGLQGLLDVGPGKTKTDLEDESMEEEETENQTTVGLGASIDLKRLINTPIGLTAAYQHKNGLLARGELNEGADTWNLGVFYTGRRSLSVGIDLISARIPQAQSTDKVNVFGGRFSLRYDLR